MNLNQNEPPAKKRISVKISALFHPTLAQEIKCIRGQPQAWLFYHALWLLHGKCVGFSCFCIFCIRAGKIHTHEMQHMNRALQSKRPHQVTHCKLASLQKQAYKSKSKVSLPLSVAATGWLWDEGKASQESLVTNLWTSDRNVCVCVCAFQNANEGKSSSQKPNIRTSPTLQQRVPVGSQKMTPGCGAAMVPAELGSGYGVHPSSNGLPQGSNVDSNRTGGSPSLKFSGRCKGANSLLRSAHKKKCTYIKIHPTV